MRLLAALRRKRGTARSGDAAGEAWDDEAALAVETMPLDAGEKAKGLLGKVGFRSATGVVIRDDRMLVATVAATAHGVRTRSRFEVDLKNTGVSAALRELSASGRLRGRVVVGLNAKDVFFGSRVSPGDQERTPDIVPATLTADRSGGGVIRHSITFKVKGNTFESVAACRRQVAHSFLDGLESIAPSKVILEPVPLALYRKARAGAGLPRRWHTCVHVILGDGEGLALLAHKGHPLAWQVFPFSEGGEIYAVAGPVMTFASYADAKLELAGIDGVVFHGEDRSLLASMCKEHLGLDAIVGPAVGLDAESEVLALAASGLGARAFDVDLCQPLRPPRGPLRAFPKLTAAAMCLAVAAGSCLLLDGAETLERRARRTMDRARRSAKVAGMRVGDLKKRREFLSVQLDEASVFLASRVLWTPLLRELPTLVPSTAVVTSIIGSNKLPVKDRATGRRVRKDLLSVAFEAKVPAEVAFPTEPQEIVESFAGAASFQRHFDDVRSGTLVRKRPQGSDEREDSALFVVTARRKLERN